MTATAILTQARAAGLRIQKAGGKLTIRGAGSRPAELMEAIRTEKAAILALIAAETGTLSEECERCEESLEAIS